MKKSIKQVLLLLVLLVPALSMAHEGHAVPGTLTHELHHASWLVFGCTAVFAAVLILLSVLRQNDDEL